MKVPAVLNTKEGQWAVIGIMGLLVVYFVVKGAAKGVAAVASGVGGVVSGNNVITQNTTDADGSPETAYEGAGVLGTLGAATNTASGGTLASFGNWIASILPGSGNDYDPNAPAPSGTTRDQVVTPNYVTDTSQLF